MTSKAAPLTKDVKFLAGSFLASGAVHLVRPETFEPIMPDLVPAHREVIYASGIAELVCAAGLLHPRTRRLAGWASVGVLLAVYPANFKMAGDALKSDDKKFTAAALARLPLQLPLIRAALRAARG
ncbi:MAG: DoxX family protein [Marmoricola sp.]